MSVASPSRAAFPGSQAGRHPRLHFRGLLRLHSNYGPLDRSTAQGGLCHRASIHPVTRTNRLPATRSNRQLSGWFLPPLVIRAFWAHYDLVAFGALVTALIVGAVPVEQAFQGFGHSATVVIALVLIISRGLSNSGVVDLVASRLVDGARALWLHVGVMSSLAAVLSAVMNKRGRPGVADAGRSAGRPRGGSLAGADVDAAVFRVDPGRHGDADRHAAQYRHRHLPG